MGTNLSGWSVLPFLLILTTTTFLSGCTQESTLSPPPIPTPSPVPITPPPPASTSTSTTNPTLITPTPDGNVTLYVLNASPTTPTVALTVWIDDQLVVEDDFANQSELPSLAPYQRIPLHLENGAHQLRANVNGTLAFTTTFEVEGALWAILGYEYQPADGTVPVGMLGWETRTTPIQFQ